MPTIAADGIYYVDLGPDPTFTDGSFISVYPEDCQFSDQIRANGEISFQISYSATDQDGNRVVIPPDPPEYVPFIGAYRSYYRLRCGDIAIQAGLITSPGTTLGSDFMTITGKTWEHIFDRWIYPFDGRTSPDHTQDFQQPNTYINDELIGSGNPLPGTGLAYQANNRDVIRIWSDVMSIMMNDVPYRLIFDIADLAGLSTIKTNYQLALGDTTNLSSLINQLAGTGQGFDWWVGWDMKVRWGSPFRFGPVSAPSIRYYLTIADDDSGFLIAISFTNNGPNTTHAMGSGAGLATQTTLSRSYGYGPAQIEFTRMDAAYDFGDVRNVAQLVGKTQRQLSLDMQPQHNIPLSVDPAYYPGGPMQYWADWRKGRAIHIIMGMGFHHIDSAHQLVSYQAKLTNQGDAQVDWTISQIYDVSATAGSAEG